MALIIMKVIYFLNFNFNSKPLDNKYDYKLNPI